MRQKIANSVCVICKLCAPFLRILHKFCATFQPVFSMVQLSVTPLYYPEYRGLLLHLKVKELLFNLQLTLSLRLLKMHCD